LNGASQPSSTGATIAGHQKSLTTFASPPSADRNKKTPNYFGALYILTNTVMTYSTPKEFVCHHHALFVVIVMIAQI
jgi:hypothetical protein